MSWNKPKEIQADMFGGELVRFSDRVAQQREPVKATPVPKQAYTRPRPVQPRPMYGPASRVPVSDADIEHIKRSQRVKALMEQGKSYQEACRIVMPEWYRGE